MTQALCAYCKQTGPLTREHLWPASLHRRLVEANGEPEPLFWLSRLKKDIKGEPQIADVCAHCNNRTLSELDGYICALFDSAFVKLPARHDVVQFEFDYHKLKRWLLKLCYNSARIHSSLDLFAFEALLPYILGKDDKLGRFARLFVQLSYRGEVPAEFIPAEIHERPYVLEPSVNRLGHMLFRAEGIGEKILRAIHLRAFTFYVAFFKLGERRHVMDYFSDVFVRSLSEVTLLRPSINRVSLVCNGIDAWTSFMNSRDDVQFVKDGLTAAAR
jgi:hypothetical protein